MACFGRSSVGLRGTAGSVTRALRYSVVGKPVRSVFSLARSRSFPVKSIASQSLAARSPSIIGRSLPSSLSYGRYCISTATASRGHGTDGEAGRIYRSLESSPDGKKLCVSWADGEESTYHAVWLRHNCRCPQCWDDRNAGPMVYFDSLKNVEIKATEVSGNGSKDESVISSAGPSKSGHCHRKSKHFKILGQFVDTLSNKHRMVSKLRLTVYSNS